MKKLLVLGLISFLFIHGSCENKNNKSVESSNQEIIENTSSHTKETIFDLLKTEYPDLNENDVCIVEVKEFGNLFVMGFFASDRGCGLERMYFDGNELPGDHSKAAEIMLKNDFVTNSEKLTETYHIKVINTFKTVIWSINEDFDQSKFFEPKTFIEDEKVVSEMWIQRPSGMNKERSYYLSKLSFDMQGNFISLEKTNQFSVSF
ncbi:MAG: hypothetical protein H6598_10790 [Flavobacteriales bacterium]|nr:hypothetical protein [Flavobacteriales bacterium]MCB9196698.1 hypothetical protein [Flavobacteriales bacterium]